jgi:predicted dehydrogenase
MKDTINWGILATGWIADKFANALSVVPNAKLYAVGSRNKEQAEIFARKFNIPKFYGTYGELSSDPDIDVLYVATPHPFHFDNTMMCLQQNKAVLCEKPFAMDKGQVLQMIGLARQKKLFLMEAMWTRFLPSILKVKELIDKDVIGEVIQLKSDFGMKFPYDVKGRLFNKALGGGSLLDIGIYPVFISLFLMGLPEAMISKAIIGKTDVDESIAMIFKYKNALACLSSTAMANTPVETEIYGTKGKIKIHYMWFMATKITLSLNDKETQDFDFPFLCNGYEYEAIEVNNCLLRGETESKLMTHDMSLQLIGLLDEIRQLNGIVY